MIAEESTLIPFFLFMSVALNIALIVVTWISRRSCRVCDGKHKRNIMQLNEMLEKHQRNEQRRQFPHSHE